MNKAIFTKQLLFFTLIIIQHSKIMAQNEYTIQADFQGSKEVVWEAITDFQSYDNWNTVLMMENNDQLEVGKKFKVTIIDEKGKQSQFKAQALTNEQYNSFSARQVMLGKWFFSATHYFIVAQKNESETTLTQTWRFSGILFRPFRKLIFNQLDRFNQMNDDLKEYLKANLRENVGNNG